MQTCQRGVTLTRHAGASSSGGGGGGAEQQQQQEQQHYHVSEKMGPAAAKLLRESGLSPDAVKPSGPHDIITKGDVLAAIEAGVQGKPPGKVSGLSPASPSAIPSVTAWG